MKTWYVIMLLFFPNNQVTMVVNQVPFYSKEECEHNLMSIPVHNNPILEDEQRFCIAFRDTKGA